VTGRGERRRTGWERAAAIAVRTTHLGAMAVLAGGVYFAAPGPSLRVWGVLTVATGAALAAIEASHSRHWIYQGRGVTTLLHGAVALLLVGGSGRVATGAALAIGAAGSHLPKTIRKWSFRHRRVVE